MQGKLYKVQLRFGTSELWTELSSFAQWKQEQIDANAFSEWSSVMLAKNIQSNYQARILNGTNNLYVETTNFPVLQGTFIEPRRNNEPVEEYRFIISENGETVDDSGWLQHSYDNTIDIYETETYLENEYSAVYQIKTKNGYVEQSAPYNFSIISCSIFLGRFV